jgi:hypothetical protein
MYPSPMQELLANELIKDIDISLLSELWNNRDLSNQFYNKPNIPIYHNQIMLKQEHVKNELTTNRGFEFLNFYSTTIDEIAAVKALKESSNDHLTDLWDNWDGCELIEINGISIHETHLYCELTKNRKISRCFC